MDEQGVIALIEQFFDTNVDKVKVSELPMADNAEGLEVRGTQAGDHVRFLMSLLENKMSTEVYSQTKYPEI